MELEYIIFASLIFLGGFVDAIAGGGGLITVPAYMALGLPMVNVIATNKMSASLATFSSFVQFLRSNNLRMKLLIKLAPFSFIGSACGVKILSYIDKSYLEKLVPFLIMVVGVYSLFNKRLGTTDTYEEPTRALFIKGALFTFIIGMYDGFFGPGTGIFLTIMLIKVFKLNFIGAAGSTRFLNLISGLTAFILFVIQGNVIWKYGLIGFFFGWFGSMLGSHFAIKKGAPFIKPVFVSISFVLALKYLIQAYT